MMTDKEKPDQIRQVSDAGTSGGNATLPVTIAKQSYTALIPLIGVTMVVVAFRLFSWSLDSLTVDPFGKVILDSPSDQLIALRGAFLFVVSAAILTVALLYVIWLGIPILRAAGVGWRAVPFEKSFAATGLILLGAGLSLATDGHVGAPATDAFEQAISDVTSRTFFGQNAIKWIIDVNNILAVLAIMMAVIMSTALIIAITRTKNKEEMPPLIRKSQLVLYSTATLLTVGIFEFFSLFRWGADLLNLGHRVPVVDSVVQSLTLGFGVFFSVLLAILFVPLLLVQREKLIELNTGSVEVRADWLEQHGLSPSLFPALTQLGALLMPLATSLLPIGW